jgi:hypothetical protein
MLVSFSPPLPTVVAAWAAGVVVRVVTAPTAASIAAVTAPITRECFHGLSI